MNESEHLQRTMEALFKINTNGSGIFRKSQGMQFSRPFATYVWLLLMLVLTSAVVTMVNGSILLGVVILPLTLPIAAYIIDIRGFEIDFKRNQIRKYRSFLGIHSGDWMPLNSFDSVRVYQHELKTQRNRFIGRGPKQFDSHAFYYVRLVSPTLSKSISLLELSDFRRTTYQAEKIARSARLKFIERPAKLKVDKV